MNVCVDVDPSCSEWAREGQCEENKEFMNKHCAVSCHICKRRCFDKLSSCARWAKDTDECETNAGFMHSNCPVSCGTCDVKSEVQDSDPKRCPIWARGGCDANPVFMFDNCASSCGVGAVVCGDALSRDQCQAWKTAGACDDNEDFMLQNCPASCGFCSKLERFYTNFLVERDHDEL